MAKYVRDASEVHQAWKVLQRFIAAGYEPFPLKRFDATVQDPKTGKPVSVGKTPRDKGWKIADYSRFDFKEWLSVGGNWGFRLLPNQIVLDMDPRNDGVNSLQLLLYDCPDLAPILESAPGVASGRQDGGRHFYLKKPPALTTRIQVKNLPGLDFKRGPGNLVVAPGSLHQVTHLPYTAVGDISHVPDAPQSLLDILIKHVPQRVRGNGGEVSLQELEKMLACIPATDFGQGGPYHDEWLTMMFSCYAATNGDGEDIWLDWCATDPQYGPEATERNRLRWLSAQVDVPAGTTFRTLLRHLSRVGRKDLVRKVGEWDEADDTKPDDGLWG